MKLIDATNAMESIDEIVCTMSVCINSDYCNGMRAMKDMALHAIEEQQTVDAVPVVRCKKCRHGIKAHGISDGWVLCTKPYVTDTVGAMMHQADWFCADGERK